jgi:hypothetical protein
LQHYLHTLEGHALGVSSTFSLKGFFCLVLRRILRNWFNKIHFYGICIRVSWSAWLNMALKHQFFISVYMISEDMILQVCNWEGRRPYWNLWLLDCRNVASFSDGPVGSSGGTPFFYLSKMDPTPNDIDSDPRCSLSLSEAPLGSCGGVDTENPTCARLTLSGKVCCVALLQLILIFIPVLATRNA